MRCKQANVGDHKLNLKEDIIGGYLGINLINCGAMPEKHRSIRKAAEAALRDISPQVPTINTWSKDHYIMPPDNLSGFRKIVWSNGVELQHQTPPGEEPYKMTEVKANGEEMVVAEQIQGGDYTQFIFTPQGKLVDAWTRSPSDLQVKDVPRKNAGRIAKTLRTR